MKSKLITLGATAIMGFSALGIPQLVVHADTAKAGNTVVSYTGTAPQPKDWGISVPATINETKEGKSSDYTFKYGIAKLAIVDADGKAFEDSSKDRTFNVSGTSQYLDSNKYMIVKDSNNPNTWAWLYSEKTEQGAAEPTTLTDQLKANNCLVSDIQNIVFTSKASGNTNSPLSRYISFGSPMPGSTEHPLDLSKNYSDTISWTATETTPA